MALGIGRKLYLDRGEEMLQGKEGHSFECCALPHSRSRGIDAGFLQVMQHVDQELLCFLVSRLSDSILGV